ncbi:Putative bactericidal permeability-increasing protein, alpha/beta domain superfamily [Septoria linicola]|uniref:Bactericidal permeability-increasing protein, alpha/beta domain superfamily n=1 Tax=Septoria linicola TaxID=215465 RepID=A0A9Q9AV40_9PEZI|nr:putative bactericidal permeability-increasing protein, alpha/beta domain superfamily [Septoria linicola]USW55984.1 Putative bactericidal permeability-increasing protein, alpha/beta domain superfamily [Septoria linicola]
MSSCFGFRNKGDQAEREPLLPQYNDDTVLQRELHQKLHTYQMYRAMSKGFMPSTEQLIIHFRTFLSSEVLNPEHPDLSNSGRRLIKQTRTWIEQFMDLLEHKNGKDQIQDIIWFLSKSSISVDVDDIAVRAQKTKAKADTLAAYQSLRTVGGLLLTNSDFRIFLNDLSTVGKEVFRDSAFALSNAAADVAKKIDPSEEEKQKIAKPGADAQPAPSTDDLLGEAADVSKVVANGTAEVAKTTVDSAADKLEGDEGKTLVNRLQQAVLKLRKRPDYNDSVSTLSLLIKRYAIIYSRAAEDVANVAQKDINENEALDRAAHNIWIFVSSFGDKKEWEKTEELFKKVLDHKNKDPQFESTLSKAGDALQKLLTDPKFLEKADEKFGELKAEYKKSGNDSKLGADVQALFQQLEITIRSVLKDEDINNLIQTTLLIFKILSPARQATNPELLQDSINIFIPLAIAAIQYIPIPRLEVSTPEVDLLLENLIIEPGHTVNQTSFLPYRLKVETYNDFELRKAKFKTTTQMTNLVTIKIDGLSAKADEIGFWLRAHKGILRLADEGIAGFELDERGVDIHIDVEIAKERLEQVLTLRAVRVHIHKLNYKMRKSKFSWLGWLMKPLLRPVIRKVMEKQLATALADFFHSANREIIFARERLRATRIADPNDVLTFFKAVGARLTPPEDPDVYTRVGVAQPGKGVFKNVYAPGSVVKVWNEEASRATERVEDFDAGGWRNEIFDTHVRSLT